MAFFDLDDLMDFEEEFVSYIVQTTLEKRRPELELLGRDLSSWKTLRLPSHASAMMRHLSAFTPSAKPPMIPN